MSKISTHELKTLIRSLTKSEKRYFHLYASRHTLGKKNKYLELFDRLLKSSSEDSESHSSVAKAIPQLKNYLYALVLKSLQAFHSGISPDDVLKDMLRQIEILFYKGHYFQCNILLARAKRMAEYHEQYRVLLEIILWEKKLMVYTGRVSKAGIQTLSEQEDLALLKIKINHEFWDIFIRMQHLHISQGFLRNAEEAKKLMSAVSLLKNKFTVKEIPSESHNYYFFTKQFYYFMTNESQCLYDSCLHHLEYIEKRDKRVNKEKVNAKTALLNNLIGSCTSLKKFREGLLYASQLRNLSAQNPHARVNLLFKAYLLEIEIYISMADYQKALPILNEIIPLIKQLGNSLKKNTLLVFYSNAFEICFATGEYSRALKFLNIILQDRDIPVREDIHCVTRMCNVILHYEMGNLELLPYVLKSSKRFLSKHHHLYDVEKTILKYFNKLYKAGEVQTKTEWFIELKEKLFALQKTQFKTAIDSFDFISWIESKIQKRPFAEVMKEKAERN